MASGNSAKAKADDHLSKKPKSSKNNTPNHLSSAFIQPSYYIYQYLNKKAEKYLREQANIEDMPDAEEQRKADEMIKKLKRGKK